MSKELTGLGLVIKSIHIASKAHKDQYRKDGKTPYIEHLFAVAYSVEPNTTETIATALLHDVIEQTGTTVEDMREQGIPEKVIHAVELLTRSDLDITYLDYIRDIKENPLARVVKIADINHNLSCDPSPTAKIRYRKALEILQNWPLTRNQ